MRYLDLVVPMAPIGIDEEAGMHMTLVGEGQTLSALVEGIPDDIDTRVAEVGGYDRRHWTLAGALTDRQYQAIEVTVDLGDCRTPQAATLEDVGAALDCSAATASNLLSKAEATVMGRLVDRRGGF
jgi:predicted DNA binding protein